MYGWIRESLARPLPLSHPLLTAPIGRSLLRLAGPTTGLMFVQIGVGIAETWIIGQLGTDALAGFALVVPFVVLMFNMANGTYEEFLDVENFVQPQLGQTEDHREGVAAFKEKRPAKFKGR